MLRTNLKAEIFNLKWIVCLLLSATVCAQAQKPQIKIGDIEYFGTKAVDVEKVRTTLPVHEGDELSLDALPDLISRVEAAVKNSTNQEPTDVASVCCDGHDSWIIYIGLPGRNIERIRYNSPPSGSIQFPAEVLKLYSQTMDLITESVHAQATEDRSRGYALSAYPPLRAKQLAMREYATNHAALIRRVLTESSKAEQRIAAAQLLGYATYNKMQVDALVNASRDADETVRNNAVRALGVLAESNPSIAKQIPKAPFVPFLNSGIWKDRNKGGYLLEMLTKRHDSKLFQLLKRGASDSLVEMAHWREFGHAKSARLILGRIAGIEEDRLQKLAHDDPGAIISEYLRLKI
jgi:hypothetical protein